MADHRITGSEIINILECCGIPFSADPEFALLSFGSISEYTERIRPGSLFIFRTEELSVSNAAEAVLRGASGIISDHPEAGAGVPRLFTGRVYEASTEISRRFWDGSASRIEQICILGTKGKTTTARMLHSVLSPAEDAPVAYCTTNRSFDGRAEVRFPGTVSDPTVYYPLCERAIQNGCRLMVSEMPSYAEYYNRLTGISFSYGIFTNLDRDHVSPFGHPTYENYVECKKKLASRCGNMLVNRDDPHAGEFLEAASRASLKMTYSLDDEDADFHAADIRRLDRGYSFDLITPTWKSGMRIMMPGVFNISNAVAAGGLAWMRGIGPENIAKGLKETLVEGRMEIYEANGRIAFVDYAHNGISFRAVLGSLKRDYPDRKIIVVTGIGGLVSDYCHEDNADALAAYASHCIITTDNPLSEDPAELCLSFADRILARGGSAEIIEDRKEAIRSAVERLGTDEVLLVAGKGDDREMSYFDRTEPYEGDDVLTKKYIGEKALHLNL